MQTPASDDWDRGALVDESWSSVDRTGPSMVGRATQRFQSIRSMFVVWLGEECSVKRSSCNGLMGLHENHPAMFNTSDRYLTSTALPDNNSDPGGVPDSRWLQMGRN